MNNIKVTALVPTRGDRPMMLANMRAMMSGQTKPLHGLVVFDDAPVDPAVKDLTYRYRTGLRRVFEVYPDTELVAFIEDDDWYHPGYIEFCTDEWIRGGMPGTFGLGSTYYYNLSARAFHYQTHPHRSSAFTTFLTRNVAENMRWPKDDYSFVDIDIWKQFPGKTFLNGGQPIALGIKGYKEGAHFGGIGHNDEWSAYKRNPDPQMSWLEMVVGEADPSSLALYKKISENARGSV